MKAESVLFLTYWYPNKNSKSFGIFIQRHAHTIKLNNKIIVLSLNIVNGKFFYKKTLEVFNDEANVETHKIWITSRFNALIYFLLPLHYFLLRRYIARELQKKHNFTVIHSNILFPCAIVGHWLARKINCKHYITEHWTKIDKFFSTNFYRNFGRNAYNSAKGISCVSDQLLLTLKKYTNNGNVCTIPNVIDSSEFQYTGERKNAVFTFIAVSYWANYKNPFYFLDALNELIKEEKLTGFKMVMVGKGEQIPKIKEANYNFEINYKGAMNSYEINKELNKSHIFLHGSDFETFSVIIAEALMCGLPCVVSPVGIAPEVINSSNGFIANNTIADWKEKILRCYNTSYDNIRIAEQLKNKYDLQTVGKLFSELYNRIG